MDKRRNAGFPEEHRGMKMLFIGSSEENGRTEKRGQDIFYDRLRDLPKGLNRLPEAAPVKKPVS
jgi:hypothetical protein